jgi:diguanylate cyclase (GGDEF)-like protein
MTVSAKRRADAALSGSIWAVGIAIGLTGVLAATTGILGWYPARLVWGANQSWVGHVAMASVLSAALALGLLVRLRIAQADVIRGARFLLPDGIDGLTGLDNRAAFTRALDRAIDRSQSGEAFTLLLLDLDGFKLVNDTHGHHAGDIVLAEVGRRLRHACGPEAVIGRLGGDEFGIILGAATSTADVASACRLIIEAVRRPVLWDGHVFNVGVSIGFVAATTPAASRDDLMRQADRALYVAKARGKGCAIAFDVEMDRDAAQRRFLERELRGAIINGEIDVDLQPIFSADGCELRGVEALARWSHSYRGRIMPSQFIALAEETGLIHQLGTAVLRRACRLAAAWEGLAVSVNISPVQMRRPDFVETVAAVLAETGLKPGCLVLEITEGVMVENPDEARATIDRLRAMGVRLSLDDFGTGYSSLNYLRTFRFDILKVDRSFVADLDSGVEAASILHCVISLGRALGLTVVAEGVETAEQARFLRAAGCDRVQGFHFSPPLSPQDFAQRFAPAHRLKAVA